MTRKCTVFVSALFVFLCFVNAAIAGGPEDSMQYFIKSDRTNPPGDGKKDNEQKEDKRAEGTHISLNLKGSKFGDVLRALAQLYTLNYSISSTSPGASGTSPAGSLPSSQTSLQPAMHGSGQQAAQNINDITVNFAYKGDSVDEAVGLLCKGADVFCEKEKELWVISRYEVYIIDKDIFFTYSVSNGGGTTGSATSSGMSQSISGTATAMQSSTATTAAGATESVTTGSSGSDSIGLSGNFDDFVQFIKTFLTKDGSVQISKSGYVVVVDVPSAIAKVRKVMEKDLEMNEKVTVKVDVISVALNDNYSSGVNWNAVLKKVTINGNFAPANAFSFGYNTTLAGNAVSTLLSTLGNYGKSKVVKSWETAANNGIPIFFNVTENIPYFTQSQAVTTGVAQTSTAVNYVNVGLKIKILPNIRHDTLNGGIYAEISQLEEMDSSGGSNPTTAPQTSLTNTAVPLEIKWGDSFVLTGFKTTQNSTTAQGVPWLSKIPLVGVLFGYQEKDNISSEIAIVVTAIKTGKQEVVHGAK
jgi:hypothetical protein